MKTETWFFTLFFALWSSIQPCDSFAARNTKREKGLSSQERCERILVADPTGGENKVVTSNSGSNSVGGTHRTEFKLIPSPRVPDEAEKFRPFVTNLTRPGGVLDQLGIETTGQVIEFHQPRDLNAVTSGTAGGYPVRHALDGAMVLRSLKPTRGFALEVVYPGPFYQHGFYRDDNPEHEQKSIIHHVVGHNNFALKSGLTHYRVGQGLESTRKIDEILARAHSQYDKDEVQRFYLWALTLKSLRDFYTPIHNPISDFEFQGGIGALDALGRITEVKRHPRFVTENVLEAFAANLPQTAPVYKREILRELSASLSFQPALMHSQILNEGWASLMQEILPKYSPEEHNTEFWFQAVNVMKSEAKPDLTDPYSLGVALWRRIREVFLSRPENKELKSDLEKDRAFVAYAQNQIIGKMTDEQFIRLGMDQVFVDRFNLAVVRRAKSEEFDPSLPVPPNSGDPRELGQWRILSREARRVAQMVIDKVVKPKYFYRPRVQLVNFNRPGSGEVELVIDDDVGRSFPIQEGTLAPALYALTQIIGKPVSLECMTQSQAHREIPDWIWNLPDWAREEHFGGLSKKDSLARVRVVVSPNGDVKVYQMGPTPSEVTPGELPRKVAWPESFSEPMTKAHASHLSAYLSDLYLEDPKAFEQVVNGSHSIKEWVTASAQQIVSIFPDSGFLSQAPNAVGAIQEYRAALERRMAIALDLAIKKKGGLAITKTGIRFRALPSIVNIEFDYQYLEQSMRDFQLPGALDFNLNRAYLTQNVRAMEASGPFSPDQAGDGSVGDVKGNPGDNFWGPNQQPPGGGESGSKPGEDPNDLSWVDLPEEMYARFLGEKVKLPILNRKKGESRTTATKLGGRVSRRQGQLRPTETVFNVIKRGIGVQAGESDGIEGLDDLDIDKSLDLGFQFMQTRDFVVKSRKPVKKPDIRAMVTFVLDASGSTSRYYEAFKRFVYDVEALVKASYKGTSFRYIVFDTEAHLMKDKDQFFKAQLGGGTKYETGLEKTRKLVADEYPGSRWDRYTFLLGDMEDFSPDESMGQIRKLLEDSEYFGAVAGLNGGTDPAAVPLLEMVMAEAQRNEAVGVTVLDQDGGYTVKNIKEVLRNKE